MIAEPKQFCSIAFLSHYTNIDWSSSVLLHCFKDHASWESTEEWMGPPVRIPARRIDRWWNSLRNHCMVISHSSWAHVNPWQQSALCYPIFNYPHLARDLLWWLCAAMKQIQGYGYHEASKPVASSIIMYYHVHSHGKACSTNGTGPIPMNATLLFRPPYEAEGCIILCESFHSLFKVSNHNISNGLKMP